MSDQGSGWSNYQPSKTVWFWSCVGAAVLTMIVGFSWGGWVTGSTADEMTEAATEEAVAELAAGICVHKFLAASDASAKLATLKETDSWKRDTLVQEGGWVTFADMESPVDGAAELCAEQLASTELPAIAAVDKTEEIRKIETSTE